jgi:hypothetical protein
VDEREAALIAGRVERRRRLRDVIADDGRVADVAVAQAELVVGEPDRARIVGALGLLQRAAEQRDRAGRFALRRREPRVQAPEVGEAERMEPLAFFSAQRRPPGDVVRLNQASARSGLTAPSRVSPAA